MDKDDSPIPVASKEDEPMYVTWVDGDDESFQQALAAVSKGLQSNQSYDRVIAGHTNRAINTSNSDVTIRADHRRSHAESVRPGFRVPTKPKDIIEACMLAYERVGLIRNIIDLMADFACQGVEITHPNKTIEKFYNAWFKKVRGKDRSERFLNLLYRSGNVIIRRQTAKLPVKAERELMRSQAKPDLVLDKSEIINRREIPWRYIFMNPLTLEVIGGDLAPLIGEFLYAVKIPIKTRNKLSGGAKDLGPLLNKMPPEMLKALSTGKSIPLDSDKTLSFFYKKDDWLTWAKPLLYALLDDIILLEHMRLADLAALDGIISNVRIWKLGSLEHKIMPTPAAIAKLGAILENGVGQSIDLIWGPEIEFEQHFPDVDKILGSEKYTSVMEALFQGLGVPPTLTGTATASGFTNNFISLRTLLERLQYGRDKLIEFWQDELVRVQKAMGFRRPAAMRFNHMTLTDENAEKMLWIQLADRNLISIETLLKRFDEDPEMETLRSQREEKLRNKGKAPKQAGPWFDPQIEEKQTNKLEEIEKQGGVSKKNNSDGDNKKLPGQPSPGRPQNSKDKKTRKTRTPKIRSSAEMESSLMCLWAKGAQDNIDMIINPYYLESVNKKNLRSLTNKQSATLDTLKFLVLCNLKPYVNVEENEIVLLLKSPLSMPHGVKTIYTECLQGAKAHMHNVTVNDIKQLRGFAYSIYHTNQGDV